MANATDAPRSYDFIGFGDEVPGVLALVAAAREYRRQTGRFPRTLLISKADLRQGIGGHLVRGGLSYLDRSNVPPAIRQSLGLDTYGDSSALYEEFLRRAGVVQVALDPIKADAALRAMMQEAQIDRLGQVEIGSVLKNDQSISGILLTKGEVYLGRCFIDATVNAELAQAAGVTKLSGFGVLGLPDAELPVTQVFETFGLEIAELQSIERRYLKRFTDRSDSEAQGWLNIAAGFDANLAEQWQREMVDSQGNLRGMWVGSDYADVRTKALSIAYHAFRGTKLSLGESGTVLDNGNIAILGRDRLSWNALLCGVNASQAEALARAAARPNAAIQTEMAQIIQWFKSLGATAVKPAAELYIRHAGNITGAVDPLSGSDMLAGGVSSGEAIGTFGYPFDVRGGIAGIEERANQVGIRSLHFKPPLLNIGIRHALVQNVPNLAVVSPGSGFSGYACATGRIVEFNVAVGQGVGIACALAAVKNIPLAKINNFDVRAVLLQTGQLPQIYGQVDRLEAARLHELETSLIA